MIGRKYQKKRVLALLLVILVSGMTGCKEEIKLTTGLSKDQIFKIDDETEELSELLVLLVNEKNKYEKVFGEDIWNKQFDDVSLETEVKDKVKQQLIELNMIYLMAKEEDITCSEKEKEALRQAAEKYYESLAEDEKTKLNVSKEQIEDLYYKIYVTDKYYEQKTDDESMEISDEEAKVIDVSYIYLKTGDKDIYGKVIPYDEAKIQEIKAKAQDLSYRAHQGEDIQTLADNYSDDEEQRCVIGRGDAEKFFEEAAFALKAGEVSSLIEAEDGFYIIKCMDDYLEAETQEHKKKLEKQYQAERFREIYEPFVAHHTLEFHNKVWNEIYIKDYLTCDSNSFYQIYEESIALLQQENAEP